MSEKVEAFNVDFTPRTDCQPWIGFAVPWISVFDPAITTSATRGYYVVYLFHANEPTVVCTEHLMRVDESRGRVHLDAVLRCTAANNALSFFGSRQPGGFKPKLVLEFLKLRTCGGVSASASLDACFLTRLERVPLMQRRPRRVPSSAASLQQSISFFSRSARIQKYAFLPLSLRGAVNARPHGLSLRTVSKQSD